MIHITFHQNSAEPNRVDKSAYLTAQTIMTGVLREETSIISPVILVESNTFPNYNYCYITEFNRYYYIEDIISVRNGLWELSLSVDVLMSFKDKLLECSAFIDRNEKYFAPYSIDNERVIRQGVVNETYQYTTTSSGYPNISDTNYDNVDEFCVVMNGYKISAEELT